MTTKSFEHYPKNDLFEVVDTIGVPHPFCITPKHIEAAQAYSGRLGREAIEALEKRTQRPSCGQRDCQLMFDEHEQALLVRCRTKDPEQTRAYLKSIVALCEKDGYAGFTLLDGTGGDKAGNQP